VLVFDQFCKFLSFERLAVENCGLLKFYARRNAFLSKTSCI